MAILEIIAISLGLSMDAFAVSITNGYLIKNLKIRHALRISFSFGFFQALMPVIGWMAGRSVSGYIKSFDHFIAFGILAFLGIKMIVESRKLNRDTCSVDDKNQKNCLDFSFLLLMSLATSIDALAIGISFAVLDLSIVFPVLMIGGITFIVCLIGVILGNKIGHLFENKFEIAGGIILISIGIKILVEHFIKHI